MILPIGQVLDGCQRQRPSEFPLRLKVKDARQGLLYLLRQVLPDVRWLKGYDEVASWMADNQGKGLLLMGGCGVGKTIIATIIIPHVVHLLRDKVVSVFKARELSNAANVKTIAAMRLKTIDDIGTEQETNDYGIRRLALNEIVDIAEERGDFLVLTTNLTGRDIRERYGERTFDRLRSICKVVMIEGQSLRK